MVVKRWQFTMSHFLLGVLSVGIRYTYTLNDYIARGDAKGTIPRRRASLKLDVRR